MDGYSGGRFLRLNVRNGRLDGGAVALPDCYSVNRFESQRIIRISTHVIAPPRDGAKKSVYTARNGESGVTELAIYRMPLIQDA